MTQHDDATSHISMKRLRDAVQDATAGRRPPLTPDELAAFARAIRPGADARIEIESVDGEPVIVVRAVKRVPRAPSAALAVLSARELEVAQLIARGLTNGEISAQLGIRVSTVKDHVHKILTRLALRSRQEVVALVVADIARGADAT
ncbi:MAG TPA: LuxR C-terminal-related transcriptional regulator [Gemmatimonadaceae bacterium]|jgi:DNA-binding NarL/FixJ family response regulator